MGTLPRLVIAGLLGAAQAVPPGQQPPPPRSVEVMALALSPDAKRVAVALKDTSREGLKGLAPLLRVFDIASGKELGHCLGHARAADQVSFTADGKHLVSGGWDNTYRLWSARTFKEVSRVTIAAGMYTTGAATSDGKRLLTANYPFKAGAKSRTRLWDFKTGKVQKELPGVGWTVDSIHVAPNHQLAALCARPNGTDERGSVALFHLGDWKVLRTFSTKEFYSAGAFSGDSKLLLLDKAASVDEGYVGRSYTLWDIAKGAERVSIPWPQEKLTREEASHRRTRWAAFTPDDKRVLIADHAGRLSLLDLGAKKTAWSLLSAGVTHQFANAGKEVMVAWWEVPRAEGPVPPPPPPVPSRIDILCRWHDLATGKVLREKKVSFNP